MKKTVLPASQEYPVNASYATLSVVIPETGNVSAENAIDDRTEARRLIDDATTEADFQARTLEYAKLKGWKAHHQIVPFRKLANGRRMAIVEPFTDKGFPDLVLVRGPAVWFLELKTESGTLSKEQKAWRDVLLAAGCRWKLVRPHQWDEIVRLLEG